jgi:ATP phosphoribosyltransferase regulatory subunit
MAGYLPKGFRDYLFENADALATAAHRLAEVYERWGYRRFIPSTLEDGDAMGKVAGEALIQQSFRFADRSGGLLSLRPDFTLQAARVIAGELAKEAPPFRLYYADRVFRHAADGQGALREIWQAGLELAGAEGPEADGEIIAVTLEALAALGLENLQVDIGHATFVRELVRDIRLDSQYFGRFITSIQRKDRLGLVELRNLGMLDERALKLGILAIDSFGVTDVAALRTLGLPFDEAAVAELEAMLDILNGYGVKARISLDPGEVRGLDYYTGFFFHVYQPDVRNPVAAGGRYDGLLRNFGRDLPAVGCAVDLAAVLPFVKSQKRERIHIVNLMAAREGAIQVARQLRSRGYAVSRDIVRRPWQESMAYARSAGISLLYKIEADGTHVVLDAVSGERVQHDLLG